MRKSISLFIVASMYMCIGTFTGAWVCSQSFRSHILEKSWFPFPSSHPLSIAPQLGVGLCDHLPAPSQGFAWLDLSWVSCTVSRTMSSMCYCILKNTVSLWSPLASDSYSTSTLSSVRSLDLGRRRSDVDVLFRLSFLYSLLFSVHWPVKVERCVSL